MSRYYDPVTHRFVNADGYFQSGGDILDANMSAYCRNNPIMFVDPTGCAPKTLLQLQEELLNSSESLDYNMKDISQAFKDGYNYNDKFNVTSSGLKHYNTGNKVADTISAGLCSVELSAGAGYGIGFSGQIDSVEIEALMQADLVSLNLSYSKGFDIGGYLNACFNVFVEEIGWDEIHYTSYLDDTKSYSSLENNVPNNSELFSVGGYYIIGCNATFSFNNDYFDKRYKEIWG